MSVYSIEGTGEEHEFATDPGAPYILMPYPKPSTDHICHAGVWVLSSAAVANRAGEVYLQDTEYFIRREASEGIPVPAEISAARAAVLASMT